MTQASLSPDATSAIANRPAESERSDSSSEAALWLFGLTSLTLVFASVLLLGLLAQNAVAEGPLSGFFAATSLVAAAIGLGAMTYVVATARRAGFIRSDTSGSSDPVPETPAGMHVVPATAADPARRKREQRAEEQAVRSRLAKAIAAEEARRHTRAVTNRQVAARQVTPRAQVPRPTQVRTPAPVAAAASPRPRVVVPVMPQAHKSRPAQAPVFPRMPASSVRPRTQVARTQVVAAHLPARSNRPAARPQVVRPPVARAQLVRPPMARPQGAHPGIVRPPVARAQVVRPPVPRPQAPRPAVPPMLPVHA